VLSRSIRAPRLAALTVHGTGAWNSPPPAASPRAIACRRSIVLRRSARCRAPPHPAASLALQARHAVALTPDRQDRARESCATAGGWRLPGGGRDDDEPVEEAALRELREEIGMPLTPRRRSTVRSVVIVEGVDYRPGDGRGSRARVRSAVDDLPADLSPLLPAGSQREREL
jgi:8-oxo-dGTP pyrophosphatase MutT (NUDIX family)